MPTCPFLLTTYPSFCRHLLAGLFLVQMPLKACWCYSCLCCLSMVCVMCVNVVGSFLITDGCWIFGSILQFQVASFLLLLLTPTLPLAVHHRRLLWHRHSCVALCVRLCPFLLLPHVSKTSPVRSLFSVSLFSVLIVVVIVDICWYVDHPELYTVQLVAVELITKSDQELKLGPTGVKCQ